MWSDDESEWACVDVSDDRDNNDEYSVWCTCIKKGIPGKLSSKGGHRDTTYSISYLKRKAREAR